MEIKGERIATFEKRLNKFLGVADGELVHIHDPGRLEKVLYEGNKVLLKKAYGKRKTKWDIIACRYEKKWVFTNSSYHSIISMNILKKGLIMKARKIEKEVKYGDSRIDFFINGNMFVEVKGCTLEKNGRALFPDAPTARGRRHLESLIHAIYQGYEASIIFLIFVPARCFSPNDEIDEDFARIFYNALSHGIKVYPVLLDYDGRWIYYRKTISLC